MDRQNSQRVSVSVFPSFQGNVTADMPKVENGTQVTTIQVPKDANYSKRLAQMDNATWLRRFVIFASEFCGTFILLFLGCMGCVPWPNALPPHEQISWTFGLAIMVAVQCVGHVSGAHINPAVTLASVILGYTDIIMSPIYVAGQFAGALAGYGVLWLVTPTNLTSANSICSPSLSPELTITQGLVVEFVNTSILILICCAVWDRKNTDKHDSLSIRFGFTIAVLAMATGNFTGANMNPARSFAPSLFNQDWNNHWIYWLGPLAAGVVPTIVYKYLFQTPPPEEETAEGIPLN